MSCVQIGGVELDLSRLHQSIKEQGGMQTVMDKKKWSKVADMVKIPKQVSFKKILHRQEA